MNLEQNTATDDLTAEEREILEFMLKNKRQGKSDEAKIRACDHSKDAVLSFGQQRSWLQHELNKGQSSSHDTLSLNLRVRGKLNIDAMHRSLAEIVRRHEILRTTFILQDADPVQVVGEVDPVFEYEDLSNLPDTERESCLAELLRKSTNTLFDLAQDQLFQTRLIRLAEADHVLCLTMHHIVFDEWSKGILLRELSSLYSAFNGGQHSPLPELPIQYRDFSVWQRDWLQGEVLQKNLDYWTQKLAGLSTLALPTDYPRPQRQTFNGAYETLTLSRELSDALDALSKQHGVTLFITMLSVLGILLNRYCGQDDISIGTVITNRDRDELHDLIGFFLNTLVMRLDLSGEPSLPEYMERVKDTTMGAFAHQHLPFDRLVEEVHPQRETNRNPLFQVSLTMLDAPGTSPLRIKGLELTPISGTGFESLFDLDVFVNESAAGLVLRFVYNTDLFAAATVRRMLMHYKELLQAMVTDASRPVTRLPMLTRSEYDQIVIGWNQTHADYINNETLHSLFEQQVERTPQATAVRFEQRSLDYSELDRKANDVACLLLAKNVEPGQFVGVYIERSIDLIVAILGVLKAGAAYVPLDPEYPQERLSYMVADANIRVLLSQEKFENCVPLGVTDVIYLDSSQSYEAVKPQAFPVVTEDMSAYVIYTSGSTGKPKGVMVSHRAVVNHACWMQNLLKYDQTDRVLLKAPLSFDASVSEIFDPLLNGACVVVAVPGGHRNSEYLIQTVHKDKITSLLLTPSELRMLLLSLTDPAALSTLKQVGCGGEALPPDLLQVYYEKCAAPLYNLYGPTESAIDATSFLCEANFNYDNIPIGHPVSNTRVYILDQQLQPVPIGVHGELHIGGAGLAQGYLNQPELTAEKFIADPFSDDPAARLYKTGDLARYLADGNIEFLGRIDHQVKLRGFRIELGEIESVLVQQESVRNAVAIVCEDATGDKRLVAYVVPTLEWIEQNRRVENGVFEEPPAVEQLHDELIPALRQHIREQLPAYMVPSLFVVLDEFPLNANGKLDRQALPMPDGNQQSSEVFVEPRTDLEREMAGIWREVLKLEQVGVHDNFFDLGGHSLMVTQVVSRIRTQLKIELPLSEMFEHPTVADLAQVMKSLPGDSAEVEANLIPAVDRSGDLPLSFAQERLWFLDQMEPGNAAYNMPMAVRLKGELSVTALQKTLNAIVQRHEALRTRFVNSQNGPVQIIDEHVSFNLLQADLSDLSDKAREKELKVQLQTEAIRPFDLANDLLVRGILLRLSEHEYVLLLTMHHIISDGWSFGVLFRELGDLYAAFNTGQQSTLADLPIQYVDFAIWQRNWLSGEQLERQLGYWHRQLAELNSLELPTDHVRPSMQTYVGAHKKLSLNKQLSAQLKSFSRESGVTLFMTLLGTFAVLMHRYSDQDDVVIGTPIANRNRAELESLIAFFVNMMVMRLDCSNNPGFNDFLKCVSTTVLGAFEHQDIPFEKLVETLQIERNPSRNPIFQVTFALQNAPMDVLELKGLTLEPISSGVQRTRFDLECHCWEAGNGIEIAFIYNTSLFEASTIQRMLGHYNNLLESVVADPDLTIDLLPMLDKEEEQQLLSWNQAATDYHLDQTVHALFEAQVTRTPDAVVIEYEAQVLSYDELNERANRLAHYLCQQGVGPEVMVGLYLERSVEMVVGILGILKAGGAYVPLDPDYPRQRLAFMLEDTQLPVLLTQQRLRAALPNTGAEVVCLDSGWEAIAEFSGTNLSDEIGPDSLAYVLYTSGSTGQPKGVAVPHRAVCNHMLWMQDAFPLTENDKVLQKTPFSFDASVWEFFAPLMAGARLVMARPEAHKDPHYLANVIAEQQITRVQLVPSLLKLLLDEGLIEGCPSLRHVFCGGEALLPELQKRFFACHRAELVNLYGPTEATIDTTFWQCDRHSQLQAVPIGHPIANTNIYILDRHRQPVPIGVPGEMYIGGAGLARGYLNRPELTAERFIAHPFSDQPETRLYRTGDLARYLPDGDIEHLGRADHQVKLRGFRIELGEIESALTCHEAVRDAVTIVREDETGNQRLAAYVVPAPAWIDQLSSSHSSEHVAEWQALYEETYGNVDADLELTTDFTGWNSSYTGDPIPLEEMTEWLDSTIARIMSLQPERVLEIGCGTGLLLYRLAPACECYVGTDFSAAVQQQLREMVSARDTLAHVELWHRTADDFNGIAADDFDMVVINSVVQYFPSMDYLLEVLTGAVAGVCAGGQVFVGDVRSFPLLNAYHTSVEAFRSQDNATGSELLRSVQQHIEEENELVIEPSFFRSLKQRIPGISHVEVLLKHGEHINELSAFRYDVILHVEGQPAPLPSDGQWYDWGESGYSESQLGDILQQKDWTWLGINSIPNRRVASEIAMLGQLQGDNAALPVAELKQNIETRVQQAIDPETLWRLAEKCGCELELSYTGSGADGRMDALFRRSTRADCAGKVFWPQEETVAGHVLSNFATNPLKGKLGRELIPQLKDDLKRVLPEYMLPSVFVVLNALPLSASGKVDRRNLPVPGDIRVGLGVDYVAPRSEIEKQLAQIWQEVLKLERVGVCDNFFDMGGHSLLATQVVSRIRGQLNVELPLSEMFGYPTVAELAPVVESLLDASDRGEADVIPVVDREGNLPLSFAQERLWFLDQLEPGSSAYNVPGAIKLKGKLDIEALRGSLQEIINRHEVLRTAITMQNGEAVQDIKDTFELELGVEDLSAVAEPERSVMLKRRLSEDALQPFNLTTGPMIRCRLLRLGEDEHILMFAMHHIVSDGWSSAVLFRELGALYAAFCHGRPSPLSELPIQYADFAAWQRQWLNGELLQAQLDYWTSQLKGVSNLQLPTDRPRPAIQTYSGAHASLMLDKELTEQLEKINKQHSATAFMTLLSAFSILLKRYCGQDEIVVGTPIANRRHREIEDLLGFFVNTLVMRTDVSGNPTFGELINRVKQIALGAYQHQDLPFEKLVDGLQPERDLSRNPLFQVLFVLQNAPSQSLSLEGLTLEGMPIEAEITRFDLEMHIGQRGENLHLVIAYNTDLFNADTIERMLGHYQTILAQISANPACRIEDLKLLNETEYQQVVVEWNRTDLAFPTKAQSVHELFEAEVERRPEAVALEFEGQLLTYRELNGRANQLAHYLCEHGVGPDSIVGICLERGLEAVITVLAVLKAGAGYTPLDPNYPEERLGIMLRDSQARVLLTKTDLAQRLPISEALVISLDEGVLWSDYPSQNPEHQPMADHAAYVIFTSGSTGRPKGIVMPHRVLCNLIQWQLQRWGQLGSSRTLQFSAFSFDVSVQELFSTLCAGGTLVIIDEELRRDPERLLNFMHEIRIGRIFIPYAALNQLAEVALSSKRVPGYLREIITAGEALQVTPALEYLFEQLEDCILDNQYGPAETHVVTANCLTGNAREWPRLPAIGRPIANAKIFLLDEQLSPVAIGVPGEMYIGGDCLAHGYIGQQELTEERFIRSPFSDAADARLYRTGDLARYGANGIIEFIGRIDNQVKIRGFRIELGEIEVVLSQNDNIRDCAVLIYEDLQGNKNIAAYFVSDNSFSTLSLRNFLRKKVPQYMIPTLLMKLDEIPVTPNGKTDYKTLASYTQEKTIRDSKYLPPETPAQKKIAGIWETLLNVDRIGVGDNFFDVGGHSLLLIQAKSVIEKELGVSVPIMDFFHQTLGQIATYCEKNQPPEMSKEEV